LLLSGDEASKRNFPSKEFGKLDRGEKDFSFLNNLKMQITYK